MDRPRGPHKPDTSHNGDDNNDSDQPNRSDNNRPDDSDAGDDADLPPKDGQPRRGDQGDRPDGTGPDQPRRWHEFAFDDAEETDADRDAFYAFQEKEKLRAEGYDPALLDDIFGTDADLGIVDDTTAEPDHEPDSDADGFTVPTEAAPDTTPEAAHWTPAIKRLELQDDIANGRVDVVGWGVVDERARAFEPHERTTADYVATEGPAVVARFEDHSIRQRKGDADIDGTPTELKSLLKPGATDATVKGALTHGKGQSPHIIIDARGSGLTGDDAEHGRRRFTGTPYSQRVESIRIIGDDYDIPWKRG